jgi:hypothetical protein
VQKKSVVMGWTNALLRGAGFAGIRAKPLLFKPAIV